MIEPMLKAKITNPQSIMYWGYDDRGLGDYCIAAFSLFGPSIASMSKFWLLLLAISTAAFLMTYISHPTGPPVLFIFLACAYLGLGLYSFLQTAASLTEERALEYLSYLPALHLTLFPFYARTANRMAIAGLALQTLIFVFLYHARSSIGWQILPILASTIGVYVFKYRRVATDGCSKGGSTWLRIILLPLAMLVVGMCMLGVYAKITYHPSYFGEEGGRNFYHNALMGLYGMPYPGEPQFSIDDNLTKSNVQAFIAKQRGVSVEEVVYKSRFGAAYEEDAKSYYFYLFRKDPIGTIGYYFKQKLSNSLNLLWNRSFMMNRDYGLVRIGDTMHQMSEPGVREYMKSKDLLFSPLITSISIITLIFSVLFARGSTEEIRPAIMVAAAFFVAGLIPSVLFYNQDMRQLTGAMLSLGLLLHLTAYWLIATIWRKASRYAVHRNASPHMPDNYT